MATQKELISKLKDATIDQLKIINDLYCVEKYMIDSLTLFQVKCSCLEKMEGLLEPINIIKNVFVLASTPQEASDKATKFLKTLQSVRKSSVNSIVEIKEFIK